MSKTRNELLKNIALATAMAEATQDRLLKTAAVAADVTRTIPSTESESSIEALWEIRWAMRDAVSIANSVVKRMTQVVEQAQVLAKNDGDVDPVDKPPSPVLDPVSSVRIHKEINKWFGEDDE
ncbi:MAG: hypothetical protein AMJ46_12565 [Latescibacteria bacterium DG_63]|nr:MAG: hypothetical protein AMJ46_12565 [Latescibacteria bacterium DG_63]